MPRSTVARIDLDALRRNYLTALNRAGGAQVMAVVNFPPRQIGKFMSEVLVLGFPDDEGEVVVANIDREVANGARMF